MKVKVILFRCKECKKTIEAVIESTAFHVIIIILVLMDMVIVLVQLLVDFDVIRMWYTCGLWQLIWHPAIVFSVGTTTDAVYIVIVINIGNNMWSAEN